MTNRFYFIEHLSTQKLRELYHTYARFGWVKVEYYKNILSGVAPPELSKTEIIKNIDINNSGNYCELMIDYDGVEDGITFGLGLSAYKDCLVYLRLPLNLLDELIKKYELNDYRDESGSSLSPELIKLLLDKVDELETVKSQNYTAYAKLAEQQLKNPMN